MTNLEIIKSLLDKESAVTENGDPAFATTGNANLDLFSLEGGMRENQADLLLLFLKALEADKATALKNLFYLRDIHHGLGERDGFRLCFAFLCLKEPETAKKFLAYIPLLGRYDDLFCCLSTGVEDEVVEMVKKQLKKDMEDKAKGLSYSLLAKWMPSINASSSEARQKAKLLAEKMGLSKADYRKMLSYLRKGLIIENDLREQNYTFDYASVPSLALRKYTQAFIRNDKERFNFYLDEVKKGKKKIKVQTLYPYQIVEECYRHQNDKDQLALDAAELKWKALDRKAIPEGSIIVRDGSASMAGKAENIATSLAILFGETLQGEFHNSFITFSSKPELITFSDGALLQKLTYLSDFDDYANTDLRKVFKLILKTETNPGFDVTKPIKRIIIISDMEFDEGIDDVPAYESFTKDFTKAGLTVPQVIFWNVEARNIHFAADEKSKVLLVSGASTHIMDALIKGENLSPEALMQLALKPYAFVDEALKNA